MEINSKQEVFDILAPEFTPEQAVEFLPFATAQFEERVREHEKAKAESQSKEAVCADNSVVLKFLAAKQNELTAEVSSLRTNQRQELYALRENYDFAGNASLLRLKFDAMEHCTAEYDFVLRVKAGADEIQHLDALVNERIAEHGVVSADAVCSRTRTIADLGPILKSEGAVGIIGGVTETLRAQAQVLNKEIESLRTRARELRFAYEKVQAAWISRGIVTVQNVANSIGRY